MQRWLLVVAVVLGLLVSVLGVLLQGASAAGVSLWSSLKGTVLENTLESRFGEVWGGTRDRLAAARARCSWAARGRRGRSRCCAPVAARRRRRARVSHPAGWPLALLALGCAYLAITPALAGHASIQSPDRVFFPSDVLHVLAASVWVGGIACLLLALPAATRQLERAERSRLLLATLARFSPLALGAVIAIAATGRAAGLHRRAQPSSGLLHTTYGALIIAKTALLLALIGLGWINRERVIPALQRIVGAAGAARAAGMLARRTMRGELALMLCVFGVTAALISYAPPIDAASGPFSTNTTIGPAELEMTVEPARVGPEHRAPLPDRRQDGRAVHRRPRNSPRPRGCRPRASARCR